MDSGSNYEGFRLLLRERSRFSWVGDDLNFVGVELNNFFVLDYFFVKYKAVVYIL